MNYINRKDGGRYSDGLNKAQTKRGRTFVFSTKEEAERRFPGEKITEHYGAFKVTF